MAAPIPPAGNATGVPGRFVIDASWDGGDYDDGIYDALAGGGAIRPPAGIAISQPIPKAGQ